MQAAAAFAILAFFAANGLVAARTHTPTVDEFIYVPSGYWHLRTGDFALDPTNPPLMKMAAAAPLLAMDVRVDGDPRWRTQGSGWEPWVFGTRFMETNRARYLDLFFAARLVVLAFGVGTGVLVLARGRALVGPAAALAALFVYGTMPPLVAHASLATLDMGVTAFLFAAFVALERAARTRSPAWAAATGVLGGLAFTAKGVAALFLPLFPVLAALAWREWTARGAVRLAAGMTIAGIGAWLAVLVAYGFDGFPVPAPVLDGIRFQTQASATGEFPAFLNGAWSQTGWWHYYLVTLAYKLPIPTLALLAAGIASLVMRPMRLADAAWLVGPPLLLLYVLSAHYGKNYGVRYLLPALPFLCLLAGRGAAVISSHGRGGAAIATLLLAWQLAGTALAAPHHLAWFNELAGGPDGARRILLDSNLDWGQDLGRVKTYLDARGLDRICLGYFGHVDPGLYGIEYDFPPVRPAPGLCAVSANFLAGYPYGITYAGPRILGVGPGAWSWLDGRRPVARIGRSIFVFETSEADARSLAAR